MSVLLRLVIIGVLFAAVTATGFWMWNTRKPVPALKLNLHKFSSLAGIILSALLANDLRGPNGLGGAELAAALAAGAFFLLTVISGGLLSIERPVPGGVKVLHRLGPLLSLISLGGLLYLLLNGSPR